MLDGWSPLCGKDHPYIFDFEPLRFNAFGEGKRRWQWGGEGRYGAEGVSVGGAEMVRQCSRRYGLATGLIFPVVRRNTREYKGILLFTL